MMWEWLATYFGKRALDKILDVRAWWANSTQERGVLILGAGGVGKSTLGAFLSDSSQTNYAGQYVESIGTETFELQNRHKVEVIIPPGQKWRRDSTWTELLLNLSRGEYRGVIVLGAYGHHSLGDISYKLHNLYQKGMKKEDFVERYLEHCRKQEIEVFEQVCNHCLRCCRPVWLLTVVNKEDLWWVDRDAVRKFYNEGPYEDIVQKCLGSKSPSEFRHELAFVSFLASNLSTGQDEMLKQTAAGYETRTQIKSIERLLEAFNALMAWEKNHGS